MKLDRNPHILILPDSFKGSLSAKDAAQIIGSSFRDIFPEATVEAFPMADGGEGSSEIVGELFGAERVELQATGPEGNTVDGFFYLTRDGKAFVEFAAASGLPLAKNPTQTAYSATSFGSGELIRKAIELGAREVFLFLGGSATTDGGVGMARALGYEFIDGGEGALETISAIKDVGANTILQNVSIIGVTDVKNPLCGPNGAAAVYGPQKGNSPESVSQLDRGLTHLARIVKRDLGCDGSSQEGAGAAGGAGFGVSAFLKGELRSGPSFFLDLIEFDRRAANADLIITSEGKVDEQSLRGKLLAEILRRTGSLRTPVLSLSGVVDLSLAQLQEFENLFVFGLGHKNSLAQPKAALELLAYQVALLCSH